MKRILYLIPGFGENTSMKSYKTLAKEAELKGYEVIKHNPHWDRRVASHWINDFKKTASKFSGRKADVLGFSLGAYIAALSAEEVRFEKMILGSLSPYFSDNLRDIPEDAWKFFGKRRKEDFANHSFPTNIKSEAFFIVGEKEIPLELTHVKNRSGSWAGKSTHVVAKDAEHDLGSGAYLETLIKLIKKP